MIWLVLVALVITLLALVASARFIRTHDGNQDTKACPRCQQQVPVRLSRCPFCGAVQSTGQALRS